MKTSKKRILLFTPLAVVAACAVALLSLRSEPSGYVASYSIYPHAGTDVLHFSRGTVTLRTCCGDEPWGTYSRSEDGAWVWHLRRGTKKPYSRDILVQSGFFSMQFTEIQNPSKKFKLRRRVFAQFPL